MEWSSARIPREVIDPKYLYYSERVGNTSTPKGVFTVEVAKGPSIAPKSTIISTVQLLTVVKLSQSTFQSRDTYSSKLDNNIDMYVITFSGPDGTTAGNLSFNAVYQSAGLYLVQYVLEKSGGYDVTITQNSKAIIGSPYKVTVQPGEIKAINCFTSTGTPAAEFPVGTDAAAATIKMEAGITNFFKITMKDIHGNLL